MPNIHDLLSLADKVKAGTITDDDLKRLQQAVPHSKLAGQIEAYLLTGKTEMIAYSHSEALKQVVYHTHLAENAPVMQGGRIISSVRPEDVTDDSLAPIYTRPLLFEKLLVLTWNDDVIERLEIEGQSMERVRHAPLELDWNDCQYSLLCEAGCKSYYWPKEHDVAMEIQPWLTNLPQDRATLSSALKRQGYRLDSLAGIKITDADNKTAELDLGVMVMEDDQIEQIGRELGVSAEASQVTIWFQNGSWFKGTLQSCQLAGLAPGIYGGLKSPTGATSSTISTRGSIMDNYIQVPWTASINRQQTDFAGIKLPVRANLPNAADWALASTGFAGFVDSFNDQMISSAAKLFRKAKVRGYAGKVALGSSNKPVQFIISGPHLKSCIKVMAFLFSPTLPCNTSLMRVQVELLRDESLDDNLIQLNVAEHNRAWIDTWYVRWAGRDCDGDGITLSDDPMVLQHAKVPSEIESIDTTQWKSLPDLQAHDNEMAIRTATERIRLFSGKIGIFDKLSRRILRHDPDLMTWELRTLLSEAIQRSISAQKKNSWKSEFEGYHWLTRHLPPDYDKCLFSNIHDRIDEIRVASKAWLRERTYLRRHTRNKNGHVDVVIHDAYEALEALLGEVRDVMPNHVDACCEILSQLATTPAECYKQLRNRGRQLWSKYQARADQATVTEVLTFIVKSRQLWNATGRSSDKKHLGYEQTMLVIGAWLGDLMKSVDMPNLVLGAMLTELPARLVAQLISISTLRVQGLIAGYFLPVATHMAISPGMIANPSTLAKLVTHPNYLGLLDPEQDYKVVKVDGFTGIDWNSRYADGQVQATHLIKVQQVK